MKKEQIIARFKALFPGVKISNKKLNAMSVTLEAKNLADEAAIDAALHAANELMPFKDLAATDDTIANLKHQLKTAQEGGSASDTDEDEEEKSNNGGKGKGKDKGDVAPPWAQGLIDSNKTLSEKLAALEKEKSQGAIAGKVKASEKLKGIPEKFYGKRPMPEKEEDIETWVDEVEADWKELNQESNNNSFSQSHQPFGSQGTGNKVSSVVQAHIDAKTKPAENAGAIVGKKL